MFGARYYGVRYFAGRYFGGAAEAVAIDGDLVATEARDLAAFAGDVASEGALFTSEAADVAAFAGIVASIGTLAASEAPDVAAFAGFTSIAVDTGFRFPTAHEIISGGGWNFPENIYAKDDALCFADHDAPTTNWFLKTQGFGFDPVVIPPDAVILKVELETKWKYEISGREG